MRRPPPTVLLIDANPIHAEAFEDALIASGDGPASFEWVRTLAGGRRRLLHDSVWAVFLNLSLPDSSGVDTLDRILPAAPLTPIVVLGGKDDDGMCKTALLRGARDYLLEGHIDSYAFARAIRNIKERDAARRELFVEKERALVTLNSIGDAVLSTDSAGNVTYLNVVAEHMTGWSSKDAVGRPLAEVLQIVDSVTHEPAPNPMERAIRLDKAVGLSANCILVRRDGYEAAIEDTAAPIHDRDGQITGAVMVFHDVSMARTRVLEMSHFAQHDALTDLPNRILLKDRLAQAILLSRRHRGHLAVLFLDLDGFKYVNDSLGHAVGDRLLQSVAGRLSDAVRKSDTVSRQGGDEFVILLSEIAHSTDAATIAAKIITDLERPHSVGEHRIGVTVSIGISTFPDNGEDAETLIKHADTAMYHAKDRGRGIYQFFNDDMSQQSVERQSLEDQLRHALEKQELLLHYQPKVNLETGIITSVEALVRWQHPVRGLLLPAQFLTIAEDTGMIVGIGRWVLQEACRQTRAWLDAGQAVVPVAVNVSSLEFQGEQFVQGVQGTLRDAHLDPSFLELELTETVLMRHAESTASALAELKAIGVRVAVDDFGTGYSSLSYLTRLPIDTLKLDQSFVQDINASTDDAVVVSAVIRMGKTLRHRVIAEGVETQEQLAFLQAHGCDEGQGYYFSRPVAADAFAALLAAGIPNTKLASPWPDHARPPHRGTHSAQGA